MKLIYHRKRGTNFIILVFLIILFIIIYFFQHFPKPIFVLYISIDENDTFTNVYKDKFLCLPNGWPSGGSKHFTKFYFYPEYPSLQDIFEDNGQIVVILSTHLTKTHQNYEERIIKYHESIWSLFLHEDNKKYNQNRVINSKSPITAFPDTDNAHHIIKLQFTLPKEYQNKYNFATIQIAINNDTVYRPLSENEPLHSPKYNTTTKEISAGIEWTRFLMIPNKLSPNPDDLSYRNVPFCAIKDKFSIYVNPIPVNKPKVPYDERIYTSLNGQRKDFMRICTQNIIYDEKEKNEGIFRWALYHIEQGFFKPIIYINKINGSEENSLSHFKKIINSELVEAIYYVFPYSFHFHDQLAQEVSCTERNKGRTMWLGHNDIDEFFYYRNTYNNTIFNITVADVLKEYTTVDNFNSISYLRCPNLWMKRLSNDTTYADSTQIHYDRTKGIVIPDNVAFYYIHVVTESSKSMMIDTFDISNAHFKNYSLIYDRFTHQIFDRKFTEINIRLTKKINEYLV